MDRSQVIPLPLSGVKYIYMKQSPFPLQEFKILWLEIKQFHFPY